MTPSRRSVLEMETEVEDTSVRRVSPTGLRSSPGPLTFTGDGQWIERTTFSTRVHHRVSHAMDVAGEDVLPIDVIVAERTKLLRLEASTAMGRRATRTFLERVFAGTSAEQEARKAISWLDATVCIGDVVVIVYDPARELTTFSFPRGEALRLVGRRFMIATWCAWFASRSQPDLGAQLIRELHVHRLEHCVRRG